MIKNEMKRNEMTHHPFLLPSNTSWVIHVKTFFYKQHLIVYVGSFVTSYDEVFGSHTYVTLA